MLINIFNYSRYKPDLVSSNWFNQIVLAKRGKNWLWTSRNKEEQPDLQFRSLFRWRWYNQSWGRLDKPNLSNECKIVLPKSSPMSKLVIAWCHKKNGHTGRGISKFEHLDSGLCVRFPRNTQIYIITVLYAEVWERNLNNKIWRNSDFLDSKRNHHLVMVVLICLTLSLSTGNERD